MFRRNFKNSVGSNEYTKIAIFEEEGEVPNANVSIKPILINYMIRVSACLTSLF